MSHNLTIGFYDKDPFNFVAKDFRKEMNNKYGYWGFGYDDRIYTKSTHAGETRYALRVYPDAEQTEQRDALLKNKNIKFYCDEPKTHKEYKFSGFWAAENYFAETTQLLDYDISNVYQFDKGVISGIYFSYATISLEHIYDDILDNIWDQCENLMNNKTLCERIDDAQSSHQSFKKFVRSIQLLKPDFDIFSYRNATLRDCQTIDAVVLPYLKTKIYDFIQNYNYKNMSLWKAFRKFFLHKDEFYFVFETGNFVKNTKEGIFNRLVADDCNLKVVSQNFKNGIKQDTSSYSYLANNMPYPLKKDLSLNF